MDFTWLNQWYPVSSSYPNLCSLDLHSEFTSIKNQTCSEFFLSPMPGKCPAKMPKPTRQRPAPWTEADSAHNSAHQSWHTTTVLIVIISLRPLLLLCWVIYCDNPCLAIRQYIRHLATSNQVASSSLYFTSIHICKTVIPELLLSIFCYWISFGNVNISKKDTSTKILSYRHLYAY